MEGMDTRMGLSTHLEYDADRGVVSVIDQFMTQEIEVRKSLVDDYLRQAVIIELERLGYTVLSPES
jgi:hypothetical protein